MTKIDKLFQASGMIAAPILYLIGRALSAQSLIRKSLIADPQYLRALHDSGRPDYSRLHVSQFQIAALLAAEAHSSSAEQIKRLYSLSESQLLQDLFCAVALNEQKNGFFIEVGVGSGRSISNTYMLEKYLGWSGLLVEPNRSSHASIAACRSAQLDHRAAASSTGQVLRFQELVGAGEHSRIAGTGGHSIPDAKVVEYDVETISLTDLLIETCAPAEIGYLSLDTEGSELDILDGLDLNRFSIQVMTIEHNYNRSVQDRLNERLVPLGYRLVFPQISEFDAWYVHSDLICKGFGWVGECG
jgi:FkbM family methyltransferase